VHWGFIQISELGLSVGLFVSARLLLLLLAVSLLTLTTTIFDIADGFERILSPFARIGFPAREFSLIMSIALRFVPQFVHELQTIYRAQISRGSLIFQGIFKGGMSGVGSLIIPMFTGAFRHAETLSLAMDARCYPGVENKTRLNPLHFTKIDLGACCFFLGMLGIVIASNMLLT
jgi:energy-coupling factor transport system permease protein